jgi:hypothetical protein
MIQMLPLRSLFKYRPINHPRRFTEDIFRNRRLYFPSPEAFNDPFDCNLPLKFEGTEQDWLSFAEKLSKEEGILDPTQKARSIAAIMTKRPWENSNVFQDILESNRKKIRRDSSVFCWAGKPDDILMFAYDADGHKGICLEFHVGLDHEIDRGAPVIYPLDFPDLNYIRVRNIIHDILIWRKAPFWAHEGELRVFRYGVPSGFVSVPSHLLKRIIFGAEADATSIKLVKSWCSDWESPLILARAKPRSDSFALTIEDFDKIDPT